jgi:hypothetical protein
MLPCECAAVHVRRRVVLTGGPGAGKTALLELIRQSFCSHVRVLPEAAVVVFGWADTDDCKHHVVPALSDRERGQPAPHTSDLGLA